MSSTRKEWASWERKSLRESENNPVAVHAEGDILEVRRGGSGCVPCTHALGNRAWVSVRADTVWGIWGPQNYEHWRGLAKPAGWQANISPWITVLLPVL